MSQEKNQLSPTISHSSSVDHNAEPTTQQSKSKDKNEPVLPWEDKVHGIKVRTFAGYDLNFTGWIRKDVEEKRQRQEQERIEREREVERHDHEVENEMEDERHDQEHDQNDQNDHDQYLDQS